jgi:hypothetical protein
VVYGQAGIGKSLALEALLFTFPGSIWLTMTDGTHSVPSFLRALAGLLKLEVSRCRGDNRRAICECLKESGRLLMIDEAQLADAAVLNAIRQIHDQTRSPVLLAGQPSLARKLSQGRTDDHVGAMLYSRIGISRDLLARCKGDQGEPLFSVADVKKMFAQGSIRITRDAFGWLVSLCNLLDCGGPRAAENTRRLAEFIAAKSREPVEEITLDRLLQASRNLHGQERAAIIARKIKEERKVA